MSEKERPQAPHPLAERERLDPARATTFVAANTSVSCPPHLPEIRLRLASEAHEIWLKSEVELEAIGLPPPFWAFAWAGGQGLARFLLDHPETVAGRSVLDFASGSGLVAIAAAMAGAKPVTAADIDPFAAAALEANLALNFGGSFGTGAEKVRFLRGDLVGRAVDADLVLAGDVFYDREMAGSLIPWFDKLAAGGTTVLVGDPGRAYLPRGRLEWLGEYKVPVSRELEDQEIKRVAVWRWLARP
ncbi:class I SAM-dependent methyltransferase [Jiella pacifica]|uniref:Methyltransferase n=1 Tax=Jiella pacifica TaxID=2696469 RepID=A0A6N9T925_9HYPH|nr:50S ribosomal protein L11 methyltransferase [Jiella pacifica]NDW06189.1 methyltransferase [Jiella pacifica]